MGPLESALQSSHSLCSALARHEASTTIYVVPLPVAQLRTGCGWMCMRSSDPALRRYLYYSIIAAFSSAFVLYPFIPIFPSTPSAFRASSAAIITADLDEHQLSSTRANLPIQCPPCAPGPLISRTPTSPKLLPAAASFVPTEK